MIFFAVNGRAYSTTSAPERRLTDVLREELALTGTKIGCGDGQCGACTIIFDGRPVYSCLMCVGQVEGGKILTIEGLQDFAETKGSLTRLQQAFLDHGAVQCGFCTSGMLIVAEHLLKRLSAPTEEEIANALSGVLCRCTGYRKILDAILSVSRNRPSGPDEGYVANIGARVNNVDGVRKVTGSELYAADLWPNGSLSLRAIRSPHHHARFEFGDLAALHAKYPGLALVLTAADIPGQNLYGVYPTGKDQPVFAEEYVRYRGEAIGALVGDASTIGIISEDDIPLTWTQLPAIHGAAAALSRDAPQLHLASPNNVLVQGRLTAGDVEAALQASEVIKTGQFTTSFVEHAYLEPEAGYAVRRGDRIEIFATTQSPYMDRDEVALIMGLDREQVRVIPSAVGGGFGGKVDLSVQPMLAVAAWRLNRPVRCIYTRQESMSSTTKRHPAAMEVTVGASRDGKITAVKFHGDFNTGAYASWGPTVAGRVPIHAMGPYCVPAVHCTARAVYSNDTPAGAFRGFGVPQAAIALESVLDDLAEDLGLCPFEFRYANVLRHGSKLSSGQVLAASVGMRACLDALRPQWEQLRHDVTVFNATGGSRRRGVGIACGWYGIGNTAQSNPSTMRIGLARDGQVTLYNGALDIGQGSNTIMMQLCADALNLPISAIRLVTGDTDLTADAGKTSASRQTFISGTALSRAADDLRLRMLRLVNASLSSRVSIEGRYLKIHDSKVLHTIDLERLPLVADTLDVLLGEGTFDPPTKPLDAHGQGEPYATYSFSAQVALVEVDLELGSTEVLRIGAAADVGRAINPMMIEGQLHGAVAQGLGMALMEEFIPGRTETFKDYIIPTIGDVPPIDTYIIEDPEPLSPVGAKGVGEPALIPTAPAILNAIRHATGVRVTHVPATSERLRTALMRSK
ncbi:MAG: molybdopterin-dependent oxidoreductase [Janthinobacterium lividum]